MLFSFSPIHDSQIDLPNWIMCLVVNGQIQFDPQHLIVDQDMITNKMKTIVLVEFIYLFLQFLCLLQLDKDQSNGFAWCFQITRVTATFVSHFLELALSMKVFTTIS